MTRSRLVLETSGQRKSAMIEAASLQGASLADWLEEQVSAAISDFSTTRSDDVGEPSCAEELEDTDRILQALFSFDWSFTEDDTRYLTHDLHPYPAKFIPQIPARLIANLSMPGDMVLDPFGGSGTTAVEAVRLGRRAISFDANPLSALIGRVKTGFMTPSVRTDLDQLLVAVEAHIIAFSERGNEWSDTLISRYKEFLPDIPNRDKWFSINAAEELCLIRYLIGQTTHGLARDAAELSLSRIMLRISNQESETRYVSVAKSTGPTVALRAYLESLRTVIRRLNTAASNFQFADATFFVGDSRSDLVEYVGNNRVDLIVTSPPYPNATDYHLYHRFRLFWLGFNPKDLANVEIGSHLRHQRNKSGFDEYCKDMAQAVSACYNVLTPGRYAVFVTGDALFKGKLYSTSDAIRIAAEAAGFEYCGRVDRPVHRTKRSFVKPARRARLEQIVVFRKPNRKMLVRLEPPSYKMWGYEADLRAWEVESLTGRGVDTKAAMLPLSLEMRQPELWRVRRLALTHEYSIGASGRQRATWQSDLENGEARATRRRDPKYATHGLHPFKGKFYPQLVKALLNASGVPLQGRVLDPFCGSGTTLLEAMLNGYSSFGCDINPLAAKISSAKTSILGVQRNLVDLSVRSILSRVAQSNGTFPERLDEFPETTYDELFRWFPGRSLFKVNWLLEQVRVFGNQALVDFFEVIVSSIVREISQQDPSDLRIRRRKELLDDAPVLELFRDRLKVQHSRLKDYWAIAGRQPGALIPASVVSGDSNQLETLAALGLDSDTVDCVITSPPYATALPYIDTDRLSLLLIMGVSSRLRSSLEHEMIGSREILKRHRVRFESELFSETAAQELPCAVVDDIRLIGAANASGNVGFRRANMAALLWRYFVSMKANLVEMNRLLRPGGKAFYVLGNSRTKAGGIWTTIETCRNITQIAEESGFRAVRAVDIDVTTENYVHSRNSIKKNQIIQFQKI